MSSGYVLCNEYVVNVNGVNVMSDVKAPLVLCFRVKFYPSDPAQLKEEITRYRSVIVPVCHSLAHLVLRSITNVP